MEKVKSHHPGKGGKREGAGRPKKPGTQRLIAIRCTDEVYQRIVENTTPEERANILDDDINMMLDFLDNPRL